MILKILIAFSSHFINLESSIACWRYSVGLSLGTTFIVVSIIASCDIIFWFWISDKVIKGKSRFARFIAKKRNAYKKHEKLVKRLRMWGPLGLYFWAILPSFFCFLIGLSVQKLYIQTRLGYLCLWLGAMTQLTIRVFIGFKVLESLIKSIF